MEQGPLSSLIFGTAATFKPKTSELLTDLLDGGLQNQPGLQRGLNAEVRQQMASLMAGPTREPQAPALPAAVSSPQPGLPASLPAFLPALLALVAEIRTELENNVVKLLQLNSSRREAVAHHLDRLAGMASAPTGDAAGGLTRWIAGPRTPAMEAALTTFFDEVAVIALGQAIVLKAWSDRGMRTWKETDLGKLNYVLATALRPHVPLDREGWQITRPNLYSWYNPTTLLQSEIWKTLEGWRISDEGPMILGSLLRAGRQSHPDLPMPPEMQSYDPRLFNLLWSRMSAFGFDADADTGPMKRKKVVFSPTLRDGTMVRTGPAQVQWIGLEANPFLLLVAELAQLWWGPAAPPIWAQGTGLEAHQRDQLQLALGSPKPSLLTRIAEMEACDLSIVLEERGLRLSSRTADSARLKEHLDTLPYFKKLRSTTSSLGALQAAVALSKLRPGGLLWWAREEALGTGDGQELLSFFLDRGKLVAEWDFSAVEHHLPSPMRVFPKHLYLFVREPRLQERHANRPMRVTLQGLVRSHIELPQFLSDALTALSRPVGAVGKGLWQVHVMASPTTQKDWAERWPDLAAPDTLRKLENLRAISLPLATMSTVRPTPHGDPTRDHQWSVPATGHFKGLWVRAENGPAGRRLVAENLPTPTQETRGSGFLVLVPDESWIAPIRVYLESASVREWLDHQAERKGGAWHLSEQIVKFIPVPKRLLRALGVPLQGQHGFEADETSFAMPLPGDWERLASEVSYQPQLVHERLKSLAADESGATIRAQMFVRAARALEHLTATQARLFSVVTPEGRIRWRQLLEILPKGELASVTLHSSIRVSGFLPPHVPIARIENAKVPMPGVVLLSENGLYLHIGSEIPRLLEMLKEQLDGLVHPTWGELVAYLKLPRHLDIAEQTAAEVLRSHGEQSRRRSQLVDLLADCKLF